MLSHSTQPGHQLGRVAISPRSQVNSPHHVHMKPRVCLLGEHIVHVPSPLPGLHPPGHAKAQEDSHPPCARGVLSSEGMVGV